MMKVLSNGSCMFLEGIWVKGTRAQGIQVERGAVRTEPLRCRTALLWF